MGESLGQKIKHARLAKGMTQEELGQLLDVGKSTVSMYEKDHVVNIKLDTLKRISTILEIPYSEIMGEDISAHDALEIEKQKAASREILSANLRLLIAKVGKSRSEVSEALGVSYFTFSTWCNGTKYPRIEKLEALANYFGISIAELVGEQKEEPQQEDTTHVGKDDVLNIILRLHTDAEFLKIVEKMCALDSEKLKALKQFLMAFGE